MTVVAEQWLPVTKRTDSRDAGALLPRPGTRWVWEVENPHARELIEVDGTFWDGEEWWVRTHSLLTGGDVATPGATGSNDLGRFWEAATPVGGGIYGLTERRPEAN